MIFRLGEIAFFTITFFYGNWTYCGDYFIMYTFLKKNTQSAYFLIHMKQILYVKYNLVK